MPEEREGTWLTPQFEHDCDSCTFIGRHGGYDLYLCQQGGLAPTIIARFGDDGPSYHSGPSVLIQQEGWPILELRWYGDRSRDA